MKPFALSTLAIVGLSLLVLYACQDTPDLTQQSSPLSVVTRKLTVSGSGTGSGTVVSSPAGINCTITAGTAASTNCTKFFNQGVNVTLTATPLNLNQHAFGGWLNFSNCSGTGTCTLKMGVDRAVTALFRKGPFTVAISSSASGGNGKVQSQAGFAPRIDCTISNGTPTGPTCSASYPANTKLTLTATGAVPGFVFDGWREPSCGTGPCQYSLIQSLKIPVTFSRVSASSPAVQGRWDPPFATPVVAVHMHVLLTGKLLLWGDTGEARLWSPSTGFTPVANKPFRIYCSGHSFLPDGRLLVVGGTSPGTLGLRLATVFDPTSGSWSATSSMAQGRYYPTVTTLPDGQALAMSGHDTTKAIVTIPEVWNGSGWRRLPAASHSVANPYYPPMFVAPNGNVFLAGWNQPTGYIDVNGTGTWTTVASRNMADRKLGSAVMYAPGKILYVGGGDTVQAPTASAEVIDLTDPSPSWQTIAPMAFARRQTNATILADGSVLVTGGTKGVGFNNQAGAVHTAELWNPDTKTWKTMAPEMKNRTYHATAVLLPSGRVLSSGSGEGGGVPYENSEFSAQMFSPPYLFKLDGTAAVRPTITSAPTTLSYGQPFTVQTPDAAAVTRGTLIRLSSVTHSFNMSQLLYPLAFTATSSTSISADGPASASLAPPGPYMLFLINGSGVPSAAKIVMVGP